MKWRVYVTWPKGHDETKIFNSTEDLKTWLDNEGFCEKHGCPLPMSVTVERVGGLASRVGFSGIRPFCCR